MSNCLSFTGALAKLASKHSGGGIVNWSEIDKNITSILDDINPEELQKVTIKDIEDQFIFAKVKPTKEEINGWLETLKNAIKVEETQDITNSGAAIENAPEADITKDDPKKVKQTITSLGRIKVVDMFKSPKDLRKFIDWYKQRLVYATAIKEGGLFKTAVYSIASLNSSINSLKNQFYKNIQSELGITELDELYQHNHLSPKYEEIINKARAALSGSFEEYDNPDYKRKVIRYESNNDNDLFFNYYALTAFDSLLFDNNFTGIIRVSRAFQNSEYNTNEIDTKVDKYILDNKQFINQRFDDDLDKDNDAVNPALKTYINSTPLYRWVQAEKGKEINGSFKEIEGHFLSYNNFKEVISFLKDSNFRFEKVKGSNVYYVLSDEWNSFRSDPFTTLERIFKIAHDNRLSLMKNADYQIIDAFDTMYYSYFGRGDAAKESLNSMASKISRTETIMYDMYAMMVNQIQKMSRANYVEIAYDKDNGEVVSDKIVSTETDYRMFGIENSILNNHVYRALNKDLLTKAKFFNKNGEIEESDWKNGQKVEKIEITQDGVKLVTSLITTNTSKDFKMNHSLEFINSKGEWEKADLTKSVIMNTLTPEQRNSLAKIVSDFTKVEIISEPTMNWETVFRILSASDSNMTNISKMFNTVVASALSTNYYVHSQIEESPGVFANSASRNNVNNFYKVLFSVSDYPIDDYNKSLKIRAIDNSGLQVLAKLQSIKEGFDFKSYVKDSEHRKLQKDRLTTLASEDNYLLSQVMQNEHIKKYLQYNIFSNQGISRKSNIMTLLSSRYTDEGKEYAEATEDELNYSSFVMHFLGRTDNTIIIQPTVYSDRKNIFVKPINLGVKITDPNNLSSSKTLNEMSVSELRTFEFNSMKAHASMIMNNIVEDFSKLIYNSTNENLKALATSIKDYDKLDDNGKLNCYKELMYRLATENITRDDIENTIRQIQTDSGKTINLIDQLHLIYTKDGKIDINPSLYNFFNGYLGERAREAFDTDKFKIAKSYAYKVQNLSIEWITSKGNKVKEVQDGVKRMLDKFKLDSVKGLPTDFEKAMEWYEENWVSPSKELIMFKVTHKDGTVDSHLTLNEINDPNVTIELNPAVNRYLALDNLAVSNYNAIVYGFPFAHPAKRIAKRVSTYINSQEDFYNFDNNSLVNDYSQRTNASYKRSTVGGATINTWLNKTKNGTAGIVNLATVEDPREDFQNIMGDTENLEVNNGDLIENPFFAILSRNSVSEVSQSPVHGKPIGYGALPGYSSFTFLKCATHTLNNDRIRNSVGKNNLGRLFKKLTDRNWRVPIIVTLDDIKWRNFNNSNNDLQHHNSNVLLNPRFKFVVRGEDNSLKTVYATVTGLNYKGSNFENKELCNHYDRKIQYLTEQNGRYVPCNKDGQTTWIENGETVKASDIKEFTDEVNINSNYSLWKAIGGEQSIDGNDYFDESSVEIVANFATKAQNLNTLLTRLNEIRNATTPDNYYSKYSDENINDYLAPTKINGQTRKMGATTPCTFVSPGKVSDIHYLAYISAVKNGANNLMRAKSLYTDESFIFSQMTTDFIGTLLSSDESIDDNSDVAEMTQVISSLMQRGTSQDLANQVYEAIGGDILEKANVYNEVAKDRGSILKLITKAVRDTFDTEDLSNEGLASNFIKSVLKYGNEERIPIDDISIYNRAAVNFINGINQQVIRRRFPGIMAVLAPSHDSIGVIEDENGNTYTKSDYINKFGPIDGIKIKEIPRNQITEVKIGDWIILDNAITQVVAENKSIDPSVTTKTIGYNIGSPSIVRYISLRELRNKVRTNPKSYKGVQLIRSLGRNLRAQSYEYIAEYNGQNIKVDAFDLDSSIFSYDLKSELENYRKTGKISERMNLFLKYVESHKNSPYIDSKETVDKLLSNIRKSDASIPVTKLPEARKIHLLVGEWISSDLKEITNNSRMPVPINIKNAYAKDVESSPYLRITNTKYIPNEALLPRLMAQTFKIRLGDNLSDILGSSDSEAENLNTTIEFFRNRLREENLDVFNDTAIKDADGNILTPIVLKAKAVQNSLYVVVGDEDLNTLKQAGKAASTSLTQVNLHIKETINDKYVIDDQGNRFMKYVDGMELYTYKDKSGAKRYVLKVNEDNDISKILKASKQTLSGKVDLTKIDDDIMERARTMAISFREQALKFIVARIPAQNMQSFMNMKIVGYVDSDANVIHVCAEQLWYQGSDFDIDKDFTLGASFDSSGQFYGWSGLFSYKTPKLFRKSLQLPFPKAQYNTVELGAEKGGTDVTELMQEIFKLHPSGNPSEEDELKLLDIYKKLIEASNEGRVYIREGNIGILNNILAAHNNYLEATNTFEEATKNKIFYDIWTIGTNAVNMISQTTPVSVEELRVIADKQDADDVETNNLNPAVRSTAQFQNSIGKICIGISAVGIKVYSTLLTYFNNKVNSKKAWTIKDWTITLSQLRANTSDVTKDKFTTIIPGVNYDKLETVYMINEDGTPILNADGSKQSVLDCKVGNTSLREDVKKWGATIDVFSSLSVLLNASTDNAKELILERVNTNPDTLPICIYLLYRGMSLTNIANFMTSPLMKLIKTRTRSNIFSSSKSNTRLFSAIQYYMNGPDPENYIDNKVDQTCALWSRFVRNYAKMSPEEFINNNPDKSEGTKNNQKKAYEALSSLWAEEGTYMYKGTSTNKNRSIRWCATNNAKLVETAYPYFLNYIRDIHPAISRYYFVLTDAELREGADISEQLDEINDSGISQYLSADTSKNYTALFLRYLNDIISRNRELQGIDEVMKQKTNMGLQEAFEFIQEARDGSYETSLVGSFASLNQGIKTALEDQLNFENNIRNRLSSCLKNEPKNLKNIVTALEGLSIDNSTIREKLKILLETPANKNINGVSINSTLKSTINRLLDTFNEEQLKEYLTNDGTYSYSNSYFNISDIINDTNKVLKSRIALVKKFVNPLSVLDENPNFSAMLSAYGISEQFLKESTLRRNIIPKLITTLRINGLIDNYTHLNRKTITNINAFITENLIDNFLNTQTIDKNTFDYLEQNADNHFVNGKWVDWEDEDKKLNLNNIDDRKTFKYYMEEYLLLKKSVNGTDDFYKHLVAKSTTNRHNFPYPVVAVDFDMSVREDINKANKRELEQAYSKISSEDPNFSDMLFLYNLITNSGYNGQFAFTTLFKSDLTRPNSKATKYMQYESDLADNVDTFQYNQNDLLLLFNKKDMSKPIIVKNDNGDFEVQINNQHIPINTNPEQVITILLFKNKLINSVNLNEKIVLCSQIEKLMSEGTLQFENHC